MDELVTTDATQALARADARYEQALALLDGADGKRKGRWPGSAVPKKGKRWGPTDDKPFKPLPYLHLPIGMTDKEVDQFLREQRLTDLQKKIQAGELEDVDPDIRPPSPPPIYDKQGNRVNARDTRLRKAMLTEQDRLIRFMMKTLEGYQPPVDWRPRKLIKKIIIPVERYPTASFMGVIIGARGVNHKRLQEVSGCKIFIRGKEVGDKFQSDEELHMPMHVHIEGDTEEQILEAERLVTPLLDPSSPEFEYARTRGMEQVAVVNGFTIKKSEHRCGVCGAVGHLGFECPEMGGENYKMANVMCTICGDKGHVASDCKQRLEEIQKEMNWKEEAEKKQSMEADLAQMMQELTQQTGVHFDVTSSSPPSPPEGPPRPQGSGVVTATAAAGAAAARALSANSPSDVLNFTGGGSSSSTGRPQAVQPPPASLLTPSNPRPCIPPPPPPPPPPPQVPPRPTRSPPAAKELFPGEDDWFPCPPEFARALKENGGEQLHKIGQESGVVISISVAAVGQRINISGNMKARARAREMIQSWMDLHAHLLVAPAASLASIQATPPRPPWSTPQTPLDTWQEAEKPVRPLPPWHKIEGTSAKSAPPVPPGPTAAPPVQRASPIPPWQTAAASAPPWTGGVCHSFGAGLALPMQAPMQVQAAPPPMIMSQPPLLLASGFPPGIVPAGFPPGMQPVVIPANGFPPGMGPMELIPPSGFAPGMGPVADGVPMMQAAAPAPILTQEAYDEL